MIELYNEDCIIGSEKIPDESIDLGIYDPPFGIEEITFDKHYKRNSEFVLDGYQEAPEEYDAWTLKWLAQAKRILKPEGSMYIFMGHTNLIHVLNAANKLNLNEINHIIWKYTFGLFTTKKFITSHYHVLFYSKSDKYKFNTYCRFGSQEKDENGKSLLNRDLEDVFLFNKNYAPNQIKNQNKLPADLIKKLILYSSDQDDVVCDFFMGNFTTAYAALSLGRKVVGFETNKNAFDYHIDKIKDISFGHDLTSLKKVENITPKNQGKKVEPEEIRKICKDYLALLSCKKKKEISEILQKKYGRGRFSIKNILDANLKNF